MTIKNKEFPDGEDDGEGNHRSIGTLFSNWKFSFRNKRKKRKLDEGAFAVFGWGTTGTRICTDIALTEDGTIAGLDKNEAVEYEAAIRADANEELESRNASGLCNISSIPIGDKGENIQPAARNFLFSMCILKNMRQDGESDMDSEEQLTRSKLIASLKTSPHVYIQFHIFGLAGGTGSGILRYLLNDTAIARKIKNDGDYSFIPVVVLPGLNKITDSEYALVNAISTYGYLRRPAINKYFKQVIFVENDLLGEHIYAQLKNKDNGHGDKHKHVHDQQNANMAHIMRTIFHSYDPVSSTVAIGGALKGFNRKYSTFGYGSSAYLTDGVSSAKHAFGKALQNNLLGYEFKAEYEKCSVIVFINVPHRAHIINIESELRMDYGGKVNIVGFYSSQDFSYTVDVVLWICGAFDDYITGTFKRLNKGLDLGKYAKTKWYEECKAELVDKNIADVGEGEAEQLCIDALNEFDEVIKMKHIEVLHD